MGKTLSGDHKIPRNSSLHIMNIAPRRELIQVKEVKLHLWVIDRHDSIISMQETMNKGLLERALSCFVKTERLNDFLEGKTSLDIEIKERKW